MEHNARKRRSWLLASLPLLWIGLLLVAPYLVAADAAPSPNRPADGPIVQDVRFSEVTLSSFTAVWSGNQILVEWQTGTEVSNAGFNLYRVERVSRYSMRLNAKLIPSQVDSRSGGARYRFIDTSAVTGGQYDYWLEFVDLQGLPHYLGTTSLADPADSPPPLSEPRYHLFLPAIHG